jgi:hypothetical protein
MDVAHVRLLRPVILGLALLSVRWDDAPCRLQIVFTVRLVVDFAFGAGWQFFLQSLRDPVGDVLRDGGAQLVRDFRTSTWVKFQAKLLQRYEFVSAWLINRPLWLARLASLFALAVLWLIHEHAAACSTQA